MNDSVSDDIHHLEEEEDNAQLDEEEEEEEELPPDWVALEDLDSGDVYYANEVSRERKSMWCLLFLHIIDQPTFTSM